MAVKEVKIRLTVDDADAEKKLDLFSKKLDDLGKRDVTVKIGVDDAVTSKLDAIKLEIDEIGSKSVKPTIEIGGIDDALAKAIALDRTLDRINGKRVSAHIEESRSGSVGTKATDAKSLLEQFALLRELGRTSERGGLGGRVARTFGLHRTGELLGDEHGLSGLLKSLFGDRGGGGGEDLGNLGNFGRGGSGVGSGLLSSLAGANNAYTGAGIAGLIALAATLVPSFVPSILGAGIGGLGAFGAGELAVHAHSGLATLQQSLASANTKKARNRLRGEIASYRSKNSSALSLYSAGSNVVHSASSDFMNALTQHGVRALTGGYNTAQHGATASTSPDRLVQTPSFLQGITGIASQVGGFLKSIGPDLGEMLRASLPILMMFVKSMETLAKILMPAFTQSMQALKPDLPIIQQGFTLLAKGIAGFIKNLGPGMKDSSIIFKGVMDFLDSTLRFLGTLFSGLAMSLVGTVEAIKHFASGTHDEFDQIRHYISSIWDTLWDNTTGRVIRFVKDSLSDLSNWRHDIANTFDGIRHDISSVWDAAWDDIVKFSVQTTHHVESDIDNWRHDIANTFDTIRHDIASVWGEMWDTVESVAKTFFQREIAGLDTWRHNVATIFDNMRTDIANVWNTIWRNTITRVQNGIADVVGWFKKLPSDIMHALLGLGTDLWNDGKHILEELLAGAESMKSKVEGFFSGLGHGIMHVFDDVTGRHSPSKEMYDRGVDLMRGLENGMQSRLGNVKGLTGHVGGNVVNWLTEALRLTHTSMSWLKPLEWIAAHESGGNPTARNPSGASGLMQTKPGTFAEYSMGGSIWNPIANAIAAIRYIKSAYGGSVFNIPDLYASNYYGYAAGGWITEPVLGVGMRSGATYGFGERGSEYVSPHGAAGGTTIYVSVNGDTNPDGAALRIVQKLNKYAVHHGGKTGIIGTT